MNKKFCEVKKNPSFNYLARFNDIHVGFEPNKLFELKHF